MSERKAERQRGSERERKADRRFVFMTCPLNVIIKQRNQNLKMPLICESLLLICFQIRESLIRLCVSLGLNDTYTFLQFSGV